MNMAQPPRSDMREIEWWTEMGSNQHMYPSQWLSKTLVALPLSASLKVLLY